MQVTPATAHLQQPALAFRYELTECVRRDDDALPAELKQALNRRGPEIRTFLNAYDIPQVAMGAPAPATRAAAVETVRPIAIVAATARR